MQSLLWTFLALSVAGAAWSGHQIRSFFHWPYPPLNELVVERGYMGDLGALLLGSRRLAAEIAYIQFLQYYGVEEVDHHDDSGGFHDITAGNYPLLKEKATRFLRLDPFFNAVVLEAAGSLAFNQKRSQEALDYLKEAVERDPNFFRYHLYITAILYKNKGDDRRLIQILEEAIRHADCPPMVKHMLGNLLQKNGRLERAVQVYALICKTAYTQYDKATAETRLRRLLEQHPELRPVVEQALSEP